MSEGNDATLGIGAVARRTGLSPDVLRVWERRHHAVNPVRSLGGTRLYSERDVRRLELLADLVGRGHRIGRLAGRSDGDLARLADRPPEAIDPRPREATRDSVREATREPVLETVIDEALEAIHEMDARALEALLTHPFLVLGARRFIHQIAVPLLQRVGDLWESGALSIASEHLAVTVLRTLLGSALRQARVSAEAPRFVFATPSGQAHEFGALAAAVLAAEQGIDAVYLGADLPAEDLAAAITRTRAQGAILGISPCKDVDPIAYVKTLRRRLAPEVALGVGGPGSGSLAAEPGVVVYPTLDVFESRIEADASARMPGSISGIGVDIIDTAS